MLYGELFKHVLVSSHASFRDAKDDGFELFPIGFDAKELISHSTCDFGVLSERVFLIFAQNVGKGDGSEFIVHGCFQRGLITSFQFCFLTHCWRLEPGNARTNCVIDDLGAQLVSCSSLYLSNFARNEFVANCFELFASCVEDQFTNTNAFFEFSVARTDDHIGIERSDVMSGQHNSVGSLFFTNFDCQILSCSLLREVLQFSNCYGRRFTGSGHRQLSGDNAHCNWW